jgi:hypothetical protein
MSLSTTMPCKNRPKNDLFGEGIPRSKNVELVECCSEVEQQEGSPF